MKITCAASVLYAQEAFSTLGEVQILPDRDIRRDFLLDSAALIVRSKTLVTPDLLRHTPVQFVATATAGVDHMNLNYLHRMGIAMANASGCNANAVAEYVIAAILHLAQKYATPVAGKTLGVVGVGQVGSRVVEKAKALGMRVLKNDPFLALESDSPDEWISLDDMLPEVDVLTLHVPFTTEGRFPTHHLAAHPLFSRLKPGTWFINASRGETTDTEALHCALAHDKIQACVLDVWENEPHLPDGLLPLLDIATPHLAGYSFEGRANGTEMCYRELCHFLEKSPSWVPPPLEPPAPLELDAALFSDEEALAQVVCAALPIEKIDRQWRIEADTPDFEDLKRRFDRFRKHHSAQREFKAHGVQLRNASDALLEKLAALGFQVSAS